MRVRIEVKNGNDELTFDDAIVTIGGRNDCDVVLRDAMVADRHCVVSYEAGTGFVLRDLGSVVGTWVDSRRAGPSAELADGATIVVGTTRIAVAIEQGGGTRTLQLSTDPQSFWWTRPGKGAFDNDPDQLVYSETRFGRFPALRLSNRVAVLVGGVGLLAALFVSSVMEPLADAGPLLAAHALVQDGAVAGASSEGGDVHENLRACLALADEQGCNVCHATGSGAPEKKCAQCHGLPGEMAAQGSWRHPYHRDGAVADQQLCVVCHTDHVGSDGARKAGTDALVGDCAACHAVEGETFDRQALIASAPLDVPAPVALAFEELRFPHDRHLAQEIGCDVCHRYDEQVRERHAAGLPDRQDRHDFASVPFETCASCHVAGSEPVGMTAEQQQRWRATEFQWRVDWHGSDADGGERCAACHDRNASDDGAETFGPELRTVARPRFDEAAYRAERARYTTASRSHEQQFADHSGGQACTSCHLDGRIADVKARGEAPPARTFWHALHLSPANLSPDGAGSAAAASKDAEAGCVSCHFDLGDEGANGLKAAGDGAYHWPGSDRAQQACAECHDTGAPLTALPVTPSADGIERVPDFPHGPHVGSASFGVDGTLADGCFACHDFGPATAGRPFTQVPRTLAGARDCTACHGGHDHVGGGDCQQCHPKADGRSNSFLAQARVTTPPWPTRPWPAPNGFRHLSAGHVGEDCTTCHADSGLATAGQLQDVRVPDERAPLCRDCHLERQFHWR